MISTREKRETKIECKKKKRKRGALDLEETETNVPTVDDTIDFLSSHVSLVALRNSINWSRYSSTTQIRFESYEIVRAEIEPTNENASSFRIGHVWRPLSWLARENFARTKTLISISKFEQLTKTGGLFESDQVFTKIRNVEVSFFFSFILFYFVDFFRSTLLKIRYTWLLDNENNISYSW